MPPDQLKAFFKILDAPRLVEDIHFLPDAPRSVEGHISDVSDQLRISTHLTIYFRQKKTCLLSPDVPRSVEDILISDIQIGQRHLFRFDIQISRRCRPSLDTRSIEVFFPSAMGFACSFLSQVGAYLIIQVN